MNIFSLFVIYFCFNENSKNEVLKVRVSTKTGDSEVFKKSNIQSIEDEIIESENSKLQKISILARI